MALGYKSIHNLHYILGMHVEMWQNNKSNWMKGEMALHC